MVVHASTPVAPDALGMARPSLISASMYAVNAAAEPGTHELVAPQFIGRLVVIRRGVLRIGVGPGEVHRRLREVEDLRHQRGNRSDPRTFVTRRCLALLPQSGIRIKGVEFGGSRDDLRRQ